MGEDPLRDSMDSAVAPDAAGASPVQSNTATDGSTVNAVQNGDLTVNYLSGGVELPHVPLEVLHRHALAMARGLCYRPALDGTPVPMLRTDLAAALEELDDLVPAAKRMRRAALALRTWAGWVPDSGGLFLTDDAALAAIDLWVQGSELRDSCSTELEAASCLLMESSCDKAWAVRRALSETIDGTAVVVDSMSTLSRSLLAAQRACLPRESERSFEQKQAAGYLTAILKDLHACAFLLSGVCTDTALGARVTGGALIAGGWGTGKSYGVASWVESRVAVGAPTALVCGYQFDGRRGFEEQLAELCGAQRRSSAQELLGALQSHAQSLGLRAVLIIDALNEVDAVRGDPQVAFAALVELAAGFPDVTVVATIRMDRPLSVGEYAVDVVRKRQYAFRWNAGVTDPLAAWRMYQNMYNLPPLILPPDTRDLRRPLLLSVLAWSIHHSLEPKDGFVKVPTVGELFQMWLRTLDADWAQRRGHSTVRGAPPLVSRACELIAEAIGVRESIEYRAVLRTLGDSHEFPDQEQLVDWLHCVGVLGIDPIQGHVRFAVQRFAEHVRARNLLYRPRPARAVARLVKDLDGPEQPSVEALRMLEALAGAAPHVGSDLELSRFLPRRRPLQADVVVLESLEGRDPELVLESSVAFVLRKLQQPDAAPWAWYSILVNATYPGHRLGGSFLDKTLNKWGRTQLHQRFVLPVLKLIDHDDGLDLLRRLLAWTRMQDADAHAALDATNLLMWLSAVPYEGLRDVCVRIASDLWLAYPDVAEVQVARFGKHQDAMIAEAAWLAAYGALIRHSDLPSAERWLVLVERDESRPHLRIQDSVASVRALWEPRDQRPFPPVLLKLPSSAVLVPGQSRRIKRIHALLGSWSPFPETSPLPRLRWLSRRAQYLQPRRLPTNLFRSGSPRVGWPEKVARAKALTMALQEWYAVQASHTAGTLPAAAPGESRAARYHQRTTDPTLSAAWPMRTNASLSSSTWWGTSPGLDSLTGPYPAAIIPCSDVVTVQAPDGQSWLLLHGEFHPRATADLDYLDGSREAYEGDETLPILRVPPNTISAWDHWRSASPARRPVERSAFVEISTLLVRAGSEQLALQQLQTNRFGDALCGNWPGHAYLAEYYRHPDFAALDVSDIFHRPTTVTYPETPAPPPLRGGAALPDRRSVPTRQVVEQLGIHWTGQRLDFIHPATGTLTLTDPSLTEGGPNSLLLTPEAADRLADCGWTLLWHIIHTDPSLHECHRYALLEHGKITDIAPLSDQ
ncbi:hypothetical protein P3T26_001271 [Streptomyces sp. MAA16]|nr:hypothetical protein [Streptomyces sp. MAA16]